MAKKKSGGPTRSLESAISLPTVNAVDELREVTVQGFSDISTIMSSVADTLSSLNSSFAKMLDLQQEQLDNERLALIKQSEANLESARGDKDTSGVSFGKDAKGIGMGIIAAISGTLIGLAQGFLEGFKDTMKAVKLMFVGLKDWFAGTKFFETIKTNVGSFFAGISMQWDLAKAWFAESKVGKALTEALDGWKAEFQLWKEGLSNGIKNLTKYLKIDDALAGWKAELELWKPVIESVKNGLIFVKDSILSFGTSTDEAKGIITTVLEKVGKQIDNIKVFFSGMFDKIGGWLKTLSGVDGIFGTIGKTIGKLFYPFTLIMSLIDTVKGAMKGYEDEGIFGAIKGSIIGFLGGIIAEPLELLKDLVSWLAKKVGLDSFSEMLDSFSFVDTFKKVINGIFDGILETLATFVDLIPGLGSTAKKLRGFKSENAKAARAAEKKAEESAAATSTPPKAEKSVSPSVEAGSIKITDADRKSEAYKAILEAEPVRKPGDPASERARMYRADRKYKAGVRAGEIKQGGGDVESVAPKSLPTKGAAVDRGSRQAAGAAAAPVVVAPSSTSVNAPTVNNSNSTTVTPASPRANGSAAGNFYVDPILGV